MESASVNTASEDSTAPLFGPGLGETQRAILLLLKRLGPATQAEVGRHLPYAPATLREHLRTLTAHGFVERRGSRHGKRGRPEVIYALTRRGDALFPHGEAAVLRELVTHLADHGNADLLERFFIGRAEARRAAALDRVRGLDGPARLAEVARLLSEQGYMAQVDGVPGAPTLRLCHCPIRDLVAVTQVPCRVEQALIAELIDQPLERVEYVGAGQASCLFRAAVASPQPQLRSTSDLPASTLGRHAGAACRLRQELPLREEPVHARAARHGGRRAADHHR